MTIGKPAGFSIGEPRIIQGICRPSRHAPAANPTPQGQDPRLRASCTTATRPGIIPKGLRFDSFHGIKPATRAGAVRSAMRGIGQAPQRSRWPVSRHRRPGAFARRRRCVWLEVGRRRRQSRLARGQNHPGEMGQTSGPLVLQLQQSCAARSAQPVSTNRSKPRRLSPFFLNFLDPDCRSSARFRSARIRIYVVVSGQGRRCQAGRIALG